MSDQKNPLGRKGSLADVLLSGEPSPQEERGRKPAAPADEVRATFIVDRHKLQLLKDYAYIERKQIKDIVDEMLTEYLRAHFDNSKAINGNTWEE